MGGSCPPSVTATGQLCTALQKQKRSSLHPPQKKPKTWSQKQQLLQGPDAAPARTRGVLSAIHIKRAPSPTLPPDLRPCGASPSPGTTCPPCFCYLTPPPPPRNPSKTLTLKSKAWHPSRFYFSSFSGKLNPLWHRQPAQLFQQRKHPQFREEEIMTNLCKIKTCSMCVCACIKQKAVQPKADAL